MTYLFVQVILKDQVFKLFFVINKKKKKKRTCLQFGILKTKKKKCFSVYGHYACVYVCVPCVGLSSEATGSCHIPWSCHVAAGFEPEYFGRGADALNRWAIFTVSVLHFKIGSYRIVPWCLAFCC